MSVHARITPPPEVRPILEQRPSSAGSAPYSAHSTGQSGIATGAPPPASALAAAEEAARNRLDERAPSGPKRLRDYEDELKALSNDEKRPRLDEHGGRPGSVPDRHQPSTTSPPSARRSLDRADDHRRALATANSENYHPSEAAHRPPPVGPAPSSLPALNATTPNGAAAAAAAAAAASQPGPLPPMADAPLVKGEEPRERMPAAPPAPRVEEPPARKMDVDEDYDDDGDGDAKERAKGEGSPAAAVA